MLLALALLAVLPAGAQAAGSPCSTGAGALCGGPWLLGVAAGEGVAESEESGGGGAGAEELEGEESEEAGAEEEGEEEAEEEGASTGQHHKAKDRSSVRLTRLGLTHGAIAALRHVHPSAASVSFSFTSSSAATLSVTLTAQSTGSHPHWHAVSRFTIAARHGTNIAHLHGDADLTAGRQKLTLSPTHGRPATIVFHVG